jgi:hypothetical protein
MSYQTATSRPAVPLSSAHPLGGADIAQLLTSTGPVVKAVLLHCSKTTDEEGNQKPAATVDKRASLPKENHGDESFAEKNNNTTSESTPTPRLVLTDLIEQIEIDTTPNKSMVAKTLGGPFTFLGQYEEEGIVLMIRNLPDDLDEVVRNEMEEEEDDDDGEGDGDVNVSQQLPRLFKISQLKTLCHERDIDTQGMLEKADLVKALMEYQDSLPPYNPHQLQPPLHKARVRGNILCLKVAETPEELDNDHDDSDEAVAEENADGDDGDGNDGGETDHDETAATKEVVVMSNDEFFLDYTKDEYVKFASRADIPEHELPDPEEAEEDDEEEEDDDDDYVEDQEEEEEGAAFIPGEEGEVLDEEDRNAMFNLVMNEVLRQYREDNGRGPNTRELLELRASIAKELDVKVAQVPDDDWDKKAKATPSPSSKKIAFEKEDKVKEFVPHEDEYNYHGEPDAMAAAMEEMDDDEDDEDDEDYAEPPPGKKQKMDEEGDEEEDLDSKPAAQMENGTNNDLGGTTAKSS